VVLSKVGGRYRVFLSDTQVTASLRGRVKHRSARSVLVGDRVSTTHHADGSVTIDEVLPRQSTLRRRMPGKQQGVRDVAANVTMVVVVGAARRPDWNPGLMDRFTAVAEANRMPLLVVVNKCDLFDDAEQLVSPYVSAGYPVLLTSVPTGRGIEALGAHLRSNTALLMGPTGVGKSSLLNALDPGLRLRTGGVSERAGVGRHTTVAAEMYPLKNDGFVVDTPGLRDIGLWGLDPAEVARAFPEFAPYAARCRFDDCRHRTEPGCEVIAAVTREDLAATRLDSYRRLLEEAEPAGRP
jgi:ribosome biogenesis GTPase